MSGLDHLHLAVPALIAGSLFFTGCTAGETMLEPSSPRSSSSSDMLTAGIKAVSGSESQENNTSLIFFVSNRTDADKKMLIWNTPLEQPLSADIFSVRFNGAGSDLDYQGRMIKRGSPAPEHFSIVRAGDTLETLVDVSSYYDMSESGSYTVSLDPVVVEGNHQLNDQTPIDYIPETLVLTVP